MSIENALRGLTAGIAVLGYVSLFLLLQIRTTPVSALAGIAVLATAALAVAGGRPAVRQLLGRGRHLRRTRLNGGSLVSNPLWKTSGTRMRTWC